MIGYSAYINKCNENKAKFKVRISSFLASDIENEYEPLYDNVGRYKYIDSLEELKIYLKSIQVTLDKFTDGSKDDEYPL